MNKPHLSIAQIVNMNVGFLGIQFSFGLQQANMSPIYQMLGADGKSLPYLWLAGPITGLLVQPLIGAWCGRSARRSAAAPRTVSAGARLTSSSVR